MYKTLMDKRKYVVNSFHGSDTQTYRFGAPVGRLSDIELSPLHLGFVTRDATGSRHLDFVEISFTLLG